MLVEAAVQGDAVAVEEQVLQGAYPLQAQRPLGAIRQVRVIEEHVETKGLGPERHRLPHTTWQGGTWRHHGHGSRGPHTARIPMCPGLTRRGAKPRPPRDPCPAVRRQGIQGGGRGAGGAASEEWPCTLEGGCRAEGLTAPYPRR